MAKKTPVVKVPAAENTKSLVDAIVTVKHLQAFIAEHGGLEKALAAVARVQQLIELTGGVDLLQQSLKIVGEEPAPPAPEAAT